LEIVMADTRSVRAAAPILIGAAVMLNVAMGVRQSLGLVMPPLTRDIAISVSEFTLALSMQNLAWGALQPLTGALVGRVGFRPVMLTGALLYCTGLLLLAAARGLLAVMIGGGLLIGVALACTASAIAMAVASRAVPAPARSLVLGFITGAGSLGSLLSAPIGQALSGAFGWRAEVLGFFVLALAMLPAAWTAGMVDKIVLPHQSGDPSETSAKAALCSAMTTAPFLVMTGAYFVCGMQLLFITTHLPTYLAICGMDPMLGAEALGVIGCSNVFGSIFFGWAGGRGSKPALLGVIYTLRSLGLCAYFIMPPTQVSTLVFAGVMGFLWLGVGPLIAGSIVEMFGLRWQAMIQGIAFMSHQLGSFLGALGGGLLFDALGSYDLAWRLIVGMGLTAGMVQLVFALARPWRRQADDAIMSTIPGAVGASAKSTG
jgi:predicted MFS family arabinose efflux permease